MEWSVIIEKLCDNRKIMTPIAQQCQLSTSWYLARTLLESTGESMWAVNTEWGLSRNVLITGRDHLWSS